MTSHGRRKEGDSGNHPGLWLPRKDLEIVHFQLWNVLMVNYLAHQFHFIPLFVWVPSRSFFFMMWVPSNPIPAPVTGPQPFEGGSPQPPREGLCSSQACQGTELCAVMAKGLGDGHAMAAFGREWRALGSVLKCQEHQAGGGLPGSHLQLCFHWRREDSATVCGLRVQANPPDVLHAGKGSRNDSIC